MRERGEERVDVVGGLDGPISNRTEPIWSALDGTSGTLSKTMPCLRSKWAFDVG